MMSSPAAKISDAAAPLRKDKSKGVHLELVSFWTYYTYRSDIEMLQEAIKASTSFVHIALPLFLTISKLLGYCNYVPGKQNKGLTLMKLLLKATSHPDAPTSVQHMDRNEVSFYSTIWLT